jgi:hypothetical protein
MEAGIHGVISTDNGVFRVCFRPCFRGVNRWWWAKCVNIFGYKFKVIRHNKPRKCQDTVSVSRFYRYLIRRDKDAFSGRDKEMAGRDYGNLTAADRPGDCI